MRWPLIISGFVLFYLVALVALTPARFVIQFVDLPDNVQLGGVQGRLWQGQVDAVRVDDILLRDVRWSLQPWQLLTARAVAKVHIGEHADNIVVGDALLSVSRNQMVVRDLRADARLVDLMAFSPTPSPFPLRGHADLEIAYFELGQPLCRELDGWVRLHDGAIQVANDWEELGSYQARLTCGDDGQVLAELDSDNRLGLSASAQLNLAGASGEFQLQPPSDAPRSVRTIVQFLPDQAQQRQRFNVRF